MQGHAGGLTRVRIGRPHTLIPERAGRSIDRCQCRSGRGPAGANQKAVEFVKQIRLAIRIAKLGSAERHPHRPHRVVLLVKRLGPSYLAVGLHQAGQLTQLGFHRSGAKLFVESLSGDCPAFLVPGSGLGRYRLVGRNRERHCIEGGDRPRLERRDRSNRLVIPPSFDYPRRERSQSTPFDPPFFVVGPENQDPLISVQLLLGQTVSHEEE